jgi:hypothetical protein
MACLVNIIPHLRLGLPSGLFPSGLHTSVTHTCRMTYPSHFSWFDHQNNICQEYKLWPSMKATHCCTSHAYNFFRITLIITRNHAINPEHQVCVAPGISHSKRIVLVPALFWVLNTLPAPFRQWTGVLRSCAICLIVNCWLSCRLQCRQVERGFSSLVISPRCRPFHTVLICVSLMAPGLCDKL